MAVSGMIGARKSGALGVRLGDLRAPRHVDALPGLAALPQAEPFPALEPLLARVEAASGDAPKLLSLAVEAGRDAPMPGEGNTHQLWEMLMSIAAVDVGAARVFEPHFDALAILHQSGEANRPPGAWGVFAAEGPDVRLSAQGSEGSFSLSGAKPWCSLAGSLDYAVVTAHTEGQQRRTFAVNLHDPGVKVEDPKWVGRGLLEIPSGTVHFDNVPARPIGGPGWYFARPGFGWGGMAVAACWLGGSVGLLRDFRAALLRKDPDQIAFAALGEAERLLAAAFDTLAVAAAGIDDGLLDEDAWPHALRVRGNIAAIVERILTIVGENLGPAPLAFDKKHAKRVADLTLYIRQHHGMRDDAQLGSLILEGPSRW